LGSGSTTFQVASGDLIPNVRNHVYHPAFAGSYSLKFVLLALVAEMSHSGMDVASSTDAGLAWEALTRSNEDGSEREPKFVTESW
jgi:hypothetical protein